MLILPGPTALTRYRRAKLLHALQRERPVIEDVAARFLHFVDLAEPRDRDIRERLDALLNYGTPAEWATDSESRVVTPRFGTISPWSSKATDIAHTCGLAAVHRIERGVQYTLHSAEPLAASDWDAVLPLLHDRMTETVLAMPDAAQALFATHEPAPLAVVPLQRDGIDALERANVEFGLALSADEIAYLGDKYQSLGRDPTDAELMMFAQVNSEHCRHKIFNAHWTIDGETQRDSLFDMIRSTHAATPDGVLSAYQDNSAVIAGGPGRRFVADTESHEYQSHAEPVHILMKVETHNHPTAISPFPGAATGSGGEIRDEGATGRGARPKAGLTGFTVSDLELPGDRQPWERGPGRPDRIASPLQIMLEGPIGGASFNNEFGRPNILGYFRTFAAAGRRGKSWGYHKPIMIAGGMGAIRPADVDKQDAEARNLLVVLGGPAMLIGLGGGAASSMGSGTSSADLDFASVQRGNPEMQRRAQQVIDSCWSAGYRETGNPIGIIHDVGAGGLSNAVPEVVDHSKLGAQLELREVPNAEPGMSPLEIWCNEAQERYVLTLAPEKLEWFDAVCRRERCPYAVIGILDDSRRLILRDRRAANRPVDMPMDVLLGKPPRTRMDIRRVRGAPEPVTFDVDFNEAVNRVLRFPTVADKSFLIHIGDRTVGGLVSRDQLVGPWQVPVSDVAVTARDFDGYAGEAMAMGERSPVAVINPAASGRLAVAEAITNIISADVRELKQIRLSANWMAASGVEGEGEALFDTVRAVADLCCELRIAIPVGKDSLSMQTRWQEQGAAHAVVAPVSLIVSAFAPVADIRRAVTPQLQTGEDSVLVLLDLGAGRNRLGASCLAQVFNIDGGEPPDLDAPERLASLFDIMRELREQDLLLAMHDRSDGGLLVTLCEMAFAGRAGLDIELPAGIDPVAATFAEEPGLVIQVRRADLDAVEQRLARRGLDAISSRIGRVTDADQIKIRAGDQCVYENSRTELHRRWSDLTRRMQALRDNPDCAAEAFAAATDPAAPGLQPAVNYDLEEDIAAPFIASGARPEVAILREQGVNSQVEMAAAFDRAGFRAIDVHMSDILEGRVALKRFQGLVACGGFSYGDVLGAGGGWAKSILFNSRAREQFSAFFHREDSFTLGVCNGCQMLANLRELIPGADHWPRFVANRSGQFEARLSLVRIEDSPSVLLDGMGGSRLLIATSHGEGRADFASHYDRQALDANGGVALRYVDGHGRVAQSFPDNPNGSPEGLAGLCSEDGRVTIMMPHPERVFRTVQHSWHPSGWGENGPWMRLFRNARCWVG